MNGNDHVSSKSQVFVNHGWAKMRCATKFVRGKTYVTYNRMQLINGTLYGGDTYILDGDMVVAIFEDIQVSVSLHSWSANSSSNMLVQK
jgi:naphtho-gamma-pyrone polyketide synthase